MTLFKLISATFILFISAGSAIGQTPTNTNSGSTAAQSQAKSAQTRAIAAVSQSPSMLLPGITGGQTQSCEATYSASYGSAFLGLTFDVPHPDKDCSRRLDASALVQFGQIEAAIQLMCQDKKIRKAEFDAYGDKTPCVK